MELLKLLKKFLGPSGTVTKLVALLVCSKYFYDLIEISVVSRILQVSE